MNIINDTLDPDTYYHIYNRGINSGKIFQSQENYHYFLRQFSKYMIDLVDVYAYCLMPNHFHFLIKVKSKEELESLSKVKTLDKSNLRFNGEGSEKGLHASCNIVSKQMAKFISSYSQGYNKINNRHGALLESPFKRIRIDSEEYLRNLIIYIHLNPIDINANYETYIFSSYYSLLSNLNTHLKKEEVLTIFENVDNFIYSHKHPPKFDFNF